MPKIQSRVLLSGGVVTTRIHCYMSDGSTWSVSVNGEDWVKELPSDNDLQFSFENFMSRKIPQ